MNHILSVEQFSRDDLMALYTRAENYRRQLHIRQVGDPAKGKIITNLFYEASTRTSSSFQAAMFNLGGNVIQINNVQFSSVSKGETLEDTIRTLACYSHAIVLRHPEAGAAQRAAKVSPVPIINAGDGENEHPTQALLDFYTIVAEFPGVLHDAPLHIIMMGDLLRGRTVKSLSRLLRKLGSIIRITWVSPDNLRVPFNYVAHDEVQTDDLASVIDQAHVLYVTRAQRERSQVEGNHIYGVTPEHMMLAQKKMLLMHPLPRTDELPISLDDDPRAAYFRQMQYGLYMRMAVLANVLEV